MNPGGPRQDLFLGIDLGTQGVRAAAYDADGHFADAGWARSEPQSPDHGVMVHKPEADWWGRCLEAIGQLDSGVRSRIKAVGLSGLFPAVCIVGAEGHALGDALLYADTRAWRQVERLRADGITLTGDEVAPRLLWLKENRPEDFARARLALGPAGYLGYRLTGAASLDPHSAFRWGGIVNDQRDGWNRTAVERLGLPFEVFPPILPSDQIIGSVTGSVASVSGVPEGTPVICGTTDTLATLFGHGVTQAGEALIYYGSSGTLLLCTAELSNSLLDPTLIELDIPYRLGAYALNSGRFLSQLRRDVFQSADFVDLDRSASFIAPGSEGLFVLPHVSGKLLPQPRSAALAGFFGLRLDHTRAHLWRGLLESFGYVLMEARDNVKLTRRTVTAAGGGARSDVWRQIVSDMTGLPQRVVAGGGAVRGAAFIAAYAMGSVTSFDEISTRWGSQSDPRLTQPRPEAAEHYQDLFAVWQDLDRAMGGEVAAGSPDKMSAVG